MRKWKQLALARTARDIQLHDRLLENNQRVWERLLEDSAPRLAPSAFLIV